MPPDAPEGPSIDAILGGLLEFVETSSSTQQEALAECLAATPTGGEVQAERALEGHVMPPTVQACCDTILGNLDQGRYAFSILIASAVKKQSDPKQDIRLAQKRLADGYSNRSFDARFVTPFLKKNGFTSSAASGMESGRNLERPEPLNFDFRSNLRGDNQLEAILAILDCIEKAANPLQVARYLLLHDPSRVTVEQIDFEGDANMTIDELVGFFRTHHANSAGQGKSRLPVLALFAVYERLVDELDRFDGTTLLPLERHTAADLRTTKLGDIQIDRGGSPFESLEVKSDKPITADLVRTAAAKLRDTGTDRYYILTTSDPCVNDADSSSVSEARRLAKIQTGCQVVTNGVWPSIAYYLRLIESLDGIAERYAELVRADPDVRKPQKTSLDKLIGGLPD